MSHIPCRFYLQGRCSFGETCRFSHDDIPTTNNIDNSDRNNNYSIISIDHNASSSPRMILTKEELDRQRKIKAMKSKAGQLARVAQDQEEHHWKNLAGPFYSIDVECVATGYTNTTEDRAPGRIALVDGDGSVLLDAILNMDHLENDQTVTSYLTELTGLSQELCRSEGRDFAEVIKEIKTILSSDSIIVGQTIHHDIEWLSLKKGVDFKEMFDISTLFRQRLPFPVIKCIDSEEYIIDETKEPKYRKFSLRHSCINLLGVDIQEGLHDPSIDAQYSIKLFMKYKDGNNVMLRTARNALHFTPQTPSFGMLNPLVDGVAMSTRGLDLRKAGLKIWKWWTSLRNSSR